MHQSHCTTRTGVCKPEPTKNDRRPAPLPLELSPGGGRGADLVIEAVARAIHGGRVRLAGEFARWAAHERARATAVLN